MIESCGPGTSTGRPASRRRAARTRPCSGLDRDDRGARREVLDHRRGQRAHAHLHDHDVGSRRRRAARRPRRRSSSSPRSPTPAPRCSPPTTCPRRRARRRGASAAARRDRVVVGAVDHRRPSAPSDAMPSMRACGGAGRHEDVGAVPEQPGHAGDGPAVVAVGGRDQRERAERWRARSRRSSSVDHVGLGAEPLDERAGRSPTTRRAS